MKYLNKSWTPAPLAWIVSGLLTLLGTSALAQTAEPGPPSKLSTYPDGGYIQSPFAAKTFRPGTGGFATDDGTFFPGVFVGWDPKSGDPIMLVGSEFRIGSKVLATIPAGYVVVNGRQKWCNIVCYRTSLNSDWSRGTQAETGKLAVVTESGAIRAVLYSSKKVQGVKGSIKRSDLKPIGYAILEGKKLIPLAAKEDLRDWNYSLDALYFENSYSSKDSTCTLIKNHKVVFSQAANITVSYIVSKGVITKKNNPPSLTMGNITLEGQENSRMRISRFFSLPIIQTGKLFDAFLPNGSVVRKQTQSAPSAIGTAYGQLLSVDTPIFVGNEETFTVALGDQILRGKRSDLPANGSPPDFITAVQEGKLNCWFFEGNTMVRYDGTGDTFTKQYSRVADLKPEILAVSPGRKYAVIGHLDKKTPAYVLFFVELKSGRTQAITLRNSYEHNIYFVADDEICIRFRQDNSYKLYRESIASLMSNAK